MLIFDFDGVLMNSIDEVAVTAYNTILGRLHTELSQVPPGALSLFKQNRFHSQPAGDLTPLMQWCLENQDVTNPNVLAEEEFSALLALEKTPLDERSEALFETRNKFINFDSLKWLNLNRPYKPIWGALLDFPSKELIILTNKNRQAVLKLSDHFGMRLRPENIYSGDEGATKTGNLRDIFQRFPCKSVSFIDDSVKNLHDLNLKFNANQKRIQLILAKWGYIGPTFISDAQSHGYSVWDQNDAIEAIKKNLLKKAQ